MTLKKGQRAKVWIVYRHDGIVSVHAKEITAQKMSAKVRLYLKGPTVRIKGCWVKK